MRDQRESDLPENQSETSKPGPASKPVEKSTMSSSDSESDSSFEDSKSPKWCKYIQNAGLQVLKSGLTYQLKILLILNHHGTETLNLSGKVFKMSLKMNDQKSDDSQTYNSEY